MLKNEISGIIAELDSPLTDQEAACGWSEESKRGLLPFFNNFLIQVRANRPIPYVGIVRSLDAWGIEGGALYDQIIHLSAALNRNR